MINIHSFPKNRSLPARAMKNNKTFWNYLLEEDLQKSGITTEQAENAGWFPINETQYCIAYGANSLVDGQQFYVIKNVNGSPKYISAKGAGSRAFIIPEVKEYYTKNPNIPLLITEGEKKALKATLEDIPMLGIRGNYSFTYQEKDAPRFELLPEIKELMTDRKQIYLIWDSDAQEKWESSFKEATERLAALIDPYDCQLHCAILPELNGNKTGVDDYLCSGKTKIDLINCIETEKTLIKPLKSKVNRIPSWAKSLVYIADGRFVINIKTGEILKDADFNAIHSDKYLGEDVKTSPTRWLLNSNRIEKCYQMTYRPDLNSGIVEVDNIKLFNTYLPTHHQKVTSSEVDNAKTVLEEHAKKLTGDDADVFLDYVAFLIQKPGQKVNWAMIVQSVHGAGKSFFTDLLRAVLGQKNVQNIDKSVIEGSFNDYLQSQLLIVEELRDGGSRYTLANKLKDLITSDTVRINPKGFKAYQQKNISNFLCFTNYRDCLAIDQHERRWAVIYSPLKKKDVNGLDREGYYKRLFGLIDGPENIAACYQYLMERDLYAFNPKGHAPETSGTEELKQSSKTALHVLVEDQVKGKEEIFPAEICELAAKEFGGSERQYRKRVSGFIKDMDYGQVGKRTQSDGITRSMMWSLSSKSGFNKS